MCDDYAASGIGATHHRHAFIAGGSSDRSDCVVVGHESPNTTHSYIEADLNMKRHALDRLTSPKRKLKAKQQNDSVERFLDSL